MIPYREIETEASRQRVSPLTIEKDYHLDWYLAALSRLKIFPRFYFYGGTAIKKLYLPSHRFSEDLDFIAKDTLRAEQIAEALGQAHQFLEKEANLFYSFQSNEIQTKSGLKNLWDTKRTFRLFSPHLKITPIKAPGRSG